LADRKGWCVFIGTPKGRNYFLSIIPKAKKNKDWYAGLFKASETNILDPEELTAAKQMMSKIYTNKNLNVLSSCYHRLLLWCFNRKIRVTGRITDQSV